MHVLIIPTAYPNDYNPVSNIFFRDQAEALASNGFKVGVLALVPITIQQIFKKRKFNFGLQVFKENGVMTYLFMFPVLPKSEPLKQWLRKTIGLWVFKKYQIDQGIPDIQHVHPKETVPVFQAFPVLHLQFLIFYKLLFRGSNNLLR